jgi:hypothetical protein
MTGRKTGYAQAAGSEETRKESSCFALTSIDLFDSPLFFSTPSLQSVFLKRTQKLSMKLQNTKSV